MFGSCDYFTRKNQSKMWYNNFSLEVRFLEKSSSKIFGAHACPSMMQVETDSDAQTRRALKIIKINFLENEASYEKFYSTFFVHFLS